MRAWWSKGIQSTTYREIHWQSLGWRRLPVAVAVAAGPCAVAFGKPVGAEWQ